MPPAVLAKSPPVRPTRAGGPGQEISVADAAVCGRTGPPGQSPGPLNQPPRWPDLPAPRASGDRLPATSSTTSSKCASKSLLALTGPAPHQPTERSGPLACAPSMVPHSSTSSPAYGCPAAFLLPPVSRPPITNSRPQAPQANFLDRGRQRDLGRAAGKPSPPLQHLSALSGRPVPSSARLSAPQAPFHL
ncbi:hypothetical protein NDU88_003616 [Pleurodeles waltl]|uniref:Uncharacterized protein n=1 Tax=Pleurodeles waltl TaxID=8319 RepID=A0AAV7T759_PLEWA|nr:hypothetical protein NDU88_003616 [Pleurodeles waltl]